MKFLKETVTGLFLFVFVGLFVVFWSIVFVCYCILAMVLFLPFAIFEMIIDLFRKDKNS